MVRVNGLSDALTEAENFRDSAVSEINSAIDTLSDIDFEVNTEEDVQYIQSEIKSAIDSLKEALNTLES
ncbi:hypothetical protein FC756_25905 [Lysinibacillus mangiferihumi]|uniref:Uncharacterized protein n=1 Tax=Lysinibacillus mangiferihumi TaxID=1130819 RepID=A0A4U2XYQ1_9BACI|nr:hypothetical protein [Lysinibacillus mangiferihumi]TKI53076.1 hypothetical protein FC756_25905 [Lysinibacillus mangiferihumi]